MHVQLRTSARKFGGYRATPVRMERSMPGGLTLACTLDLAASNAALAGGDVDSKLQPSPATALSAYLRMCLRVTEGISRSASLGVYGDRINRSRLSEVLF